MNEEILSLNEQIANLT